MGEKEHINKNINLTAVERPQKKRRRNEQNNEYIGIMKGDTETRRDFHSNENRMTVE